MKSNARAAQQSRAKIDAELIADLKKIDELPHVCVTGWEAKFLAGVLNETSLTVRQRETARQMIAKYLERA